MQWWFSTEIVFSYNFEYMKKIHHSCQGGFQWRANVASGGPTWCCHGEREGGGCFSCCCCCATMACPAHSRHNAWLVCGPISKQQKYLINSLFSHKSSILSFWIAQKTILWFFFFEWIMNKKIFRRIQNIHHQHIAVYHSPRYSIFSDFIFCWLFVSFIWKSWFRICFCTK